MEIQMSCLLPISIYSANIRAKNLYLQVLLESNSNTVTLRDLYSA